MQASKVRIRCMLSKTVADSYLEQVERIPNQLSFFPIVNNPPNKQQYKRFKPAPPRPITPPVLNKDTAEPSLPAATPLIDGQSAQVRRFLATCMPSMTHFLPNFIAFGCKNEEFLLAVTSWTDDAIDSFLKSVSSCDSNEFTGMDILVLRNHFRNYST